MKSVSALLLIILFSETIALDYEESRTPQSHKETSKRLKMIDNRNVFNPRMDYDEWKPLGRGDPLKNDPTYDYVPPVLERVHYWMDPSKRTPDPPLPNSGVLVLGSTRTEATIRPTTPPQQADSRIDTMSLLDPFLKLMDVSQYTTGFFRPTPSPNRIHSYQRPTHSKLKIPPQALQRPPYTMLMPPPPPPLPPSTQMITSFATTTTSTTESVRDLTTTIKPDEGTTYQPTILANTENFYKAVAISMPEQNQNETDKTDLSVPEDGSMILPIVSMFNNHKKKIPEPQNSDNHLAENGDNNNVKQPSEVMIPPPQVSNHDENYLSKSKPTWGQDQGFRPTTIRPMTTTKGISTLTTDPMFKHYKQPSEPMKGPFYLIIQGHSKVKTYGASKNPVNGLVSNEIKDDDDDSKEYEDLDESQKRRQSRKLRNGDEKASQDHNVIDDETPHLEKLEETFGKTNGGTSKKRYLANEPINETNHDRFVYDDTTIRNRRLLETETQEDTTIDPVLPDEALPEMLSDTTTEILPTLEMTSVTATTAVTSKPKKTKNKKKKKPVKDEDDDNLNLENLIALNEDYTAEDVINAVLKNEGQGSGFGNFVSSIVNSRSEKEEEEEV